MSAVSDGAAPIDVDGVPGLWERVALADERFLVLDYDGTLAPFREHRMEAFPIDGALDALRAIRDSGRTRLAMLTGRPLRELIALVGNLGIPMVGSHGFEYMMRDGSIELGELSAAQEERLVRAEQEARAMAPVARVERKPASVGLHTRGMRADDARGVVERVSSAWSRDVEERGLECRYFSGGVELRLREAHKGAALKRLIEERGDGALCVYIGDDETDEDAFEALPDTGIGIKVGPPGVRTRAQGRLDDPGAVRWFLQTWAATTWPERSTAKRSV